MKKLLYSLRDNKIGVFNAPCIFMNDAAAVRAFGDMVTRDKESQVGLHPGDFTLYFIGEFDAITGELLQPKPPRALATGSDFVESK